MAPQGDPPLHWDEKQNVRWKAAMPGEGHATPIIWGDRIFLNVGDGTDLYLLCVDRQKGVELWRKPLGSGLISSCSARR